MADLTITAANVGVYEGAETEQVVFGETVTQGQPVFLDTRAGRYRLCRANPNPNGKHQANCVGISITSGADGQTGLICTSGEMDLGATLQVGQVYELSSTAGLIAPVADLAIDEWRTLLGVATATDKLLVNIFVTNTQKGFV